MLLLLRNHQSASGSPPPPPPDPDPDPPPPPPTDPGPTPEPGLYRFEPPTVYDVPPDVSDWEAMQQGVIEALRQFQRRALRLPRGRSVLKIGGIYTTLDVPTQTQIDASTEYYAGGHIYFVTATVAQALTDAGYLVAGFTGIEPSLYGTGNYGEDTYG